MDIIGTAASIAKKAIIDAEGSISVSEFYMTNIATNEVVTLSMPPEEVRVKSGASFRTFQIVELGEIKLPKGETLTAVSWRGILPAASILMYPFVKHTAWENPQEIIKVLNRWRTGGEKLRLLITGTPINLDCYIKNFSYTAKGGLGHYDYEIEFIAAKSLQVKTVAESDAARQRAEEINSYALRNRAATKSKAGIYINQVNSIYELARALTGDGSDWMRILAKNGINNPLEIPTDILIVC